MPRKANETDQAIAWMTMTFDLNIKRMISDGLLKKKDVLDTYRRAKERGLAV